MTRERPILFSGRMVRAILDGSKTQTRRPITPQPNSGPRGRMVDLGGAWGLSDGVLSGEWRCPYGAPGDRLWVQETWHACPHCCDPDYAPAGRPTYRADNEDLPRKCTAHRRWRSPIYLPRKHSRILLEVVEVRAQRVQDISEKDAMAEGVAPVLVPPDGGSAPYGEGFRAVWDSLNAKRDYPWLANPFVWAVSFRRIAP